MKTKKNPLLHRVPTAAFAALVFTMSSSAHAQTWDASFSRLWTDVDNWSSAPAFNNTTDLLFSPNAPVGMVANGNSMVMGNDLTARSLTFAADVDGPMFLTLQAIGGGVAKSLTMDTDTVGGNATLSILSDATGNITIGNAGFAGTPGFVVLADNLVVDHKGSGLLLFNRGISGATFGITKTGSGTMQTDSFNSFTGPININQGTLVANTYGATGDDLKTASTINLGGGTLQIGASGSSGTLNSGIAKTYATPPIIVSSASTLEYKNITPTTYNAAFSGTGLTLNADLAVKNVSTGTTLTNAFSLNRPITGSGKITTTTYNNITASTDNFVLGRVSLGSDNATWAGGITIARGTFLLAGSAVNAAGTGVITIGTTSDAFGAGLTFFPSGGNGTTVIYPNNITVTGGVGSGFRAIKGGGTNHSVTFSGGVTLDGNLTLDHTWGATDRRITFSGAISGVGGLTITRAGGNPGTTITLNGVDKAYTGITTVAAGASLAVSKGLTSDISVTGGRFGGNGGSTTKTLSLAAGSTFFFYLPTFAPFNVSGSVTLDKTFGVASLVGGSQGEAIVWASVPDGTYNLIGTTASTFNHITNVGSVNAADVGSGKIAYFQNGGSGGLDLVVTPGVAGYAAWQQANGNTTGDLNADHDDDGVSNGTEFFLGGNTSTTGFTALPGVTNNSVTWIKAAAGYAGNYGSNFVVETSDTLAAGTWATAPEGVGADRVEITGNNVKYTFPAGSKKFARLKVTGP